MNAKDTLEYLKLRCKQQDDFWINRGFANVSSEALVAASDFVTMAKGMGCDAFAATVTPDGDVEIALEDGSLCVTYSMAGECSSIMARGGKAILRKTAAMAINVLGGGSNGQR